MRGQSETCVRFHQVTRTQISASIPPYDTLKLTEASRHTHLRAEDRSPTDRGFLGALGDNRYRRNSLGCRWHSARHSENHSAGKLCLFRSDAGRSGLPRAAHLNADDAGGTPPESEPIVPQWRYKVLHLGTAQHRPREAALLSRFR